MTSQSSRFFFQCQDPPQDGERGFFDNRYFRCKQSASESCASKKFLGNSLPLFHIIPVCSKKFEIHFYEFSAGGQRPNTSGRGTPDHWDSVNETSALVGSFSN